MRTVFAPHDDPPHTHTLPPPPPLQAVSGDALVRVVRAATATATDHAPPHRPHPSAGQPEAAAAVVHSALAAMDGQWPGGVLPHGPGGGGCAAVRSLQVRARACGVHAYGIRPVNG